MNDNQYKLGAWQINAGCVNQRDISFESHRRGKNWVATVVFDPMSPNALDRNFWRHGSGPWRATPDDIKVGDIIEVGADYYTSTGNAQRSRTYLRVYELTEKEIRFAWVNKPGVRTISTINFIAALESQLNNVSSNGETKIIDIPTPHHHETEGDGHGPGLDERDDDRKSA